MPLDDTDHKGRDRMAEFALHDRALVNAKIFRPLGRGVGSKLNDERRVEDRVVVNDPALGKVKITVVSPYPVGTKEEDLLLVLLGLAGLTKDEANRRSRPLPLDHGNHSAMVQEIEASGDCLRSTKFQLRVSPYLILRELSGPDWKPNGSAYDELEPRLKRLYFISYVAEGMNGNRRWSQGGSRLLSYHYVEGDDKERSIVITFNERLARIMVGYVDPDDPEAKPRRWYAKINLHERFTLKSDLARMLHRLFSVWIDEPKEGVPKRRGGKGRGSSSEALSVRIDTLIDHMYGPRQVPDGTLRRRRIDVRKALAEVATLDGWAINLDETKIMAYVRRLPKSGEPVQGVIPL